MTGYTPAAPILRRVAAAIILPAALFASPARAQVEVEVDPIAYALNGFSLHAATLLGSARVNVGTFGIELPRSVHGNEGWNSTMRGAGVKLDYVGASQAGVFAGLDGGYMRMRYTLDASGEREHRDVVSVGVRGGYRHFVGRRFYVAPWVGVSYSFDGDDVVIGGEEFSRSPVFVFPTVHVGWRF